MPIVVRDNIPMLTITIIELLPKHRPRFSSKQIRTLKALKIGRKVFVVNDQAGRMRTITITSNPYKDKEDNWYIDCKYTANNLMEYRARISLADTSVVPYQSGYWNNRNWLERI